jgi:dipeptidase E
MQERLIFAMGGGGFTMEPNNPLLDDFVLSLARAGRLGDGSAASVSRTGLPRILFLPTASGDTTAQINAFRARFTPRACVPEHLSLFRLRESTRTLAQIVREQDVIYVGGGSMRNLLAIWNAHELDRLLVEAWREGTVLAGLSAGAMCWFQAGVTRSSGPPEPIRGLGLLEGSLTVHADGEPERLPVWLAGVRDGTLPGGWAVDDGVGLLFRGQRLQRVVSSRPGAGAQRVDAIAGELVRHRLVPELLQGHGAPQGGGAGGDDAVEELRRVHLMRRGVRAGGD